MQQNGAAAGPAGPIQVMVPIDGTEVAVTLSREQATQLHEALGRALLEGQPTPRRRYLDIKPGGLRGS